MSEETLPGDDKPTQREQTLVKYALPVVERAAVRVARRFPGRAKPRELYAVGTIALYRLARKFQDEMSHDFADWAYRGVRCAMLDALRIEGRHERRQRAAIKAADLFLAFLRDDEYNVLIHDDMDALRRLEDATDSLLAAMFVGIAEEQHRINAEDPAAEDEEYRRALEALALASEALADEHRRVLTRVYHDEQTLVDAAKDLGISYATARRRHDEALEKLRKKLASLGVERAPPPRDPSEE
jgi:RNA polymerase sigma factor (sigma-70 family)